MTFVVTDMTISVNGRLLYLWYDLKKIHIRVLELVINLDEKYTVTFCVLSVSQRLDYGEWLYVHYS